MAAYASGDVSALFVICKYEKRVIFIFENTKIDQMFAVSNVNPYLCGIIHNYGVNRITASFQQLSSQDCKNRLAVQALSVRPYQLECQN